MTVRPPLYSVAIVTVVIAIGLLWSWQPERQVRRHTQKFLAAAESKKWPKMAALIADEYSDRWGHDRTAVLERSREVLQQFLILEIQAPEYEVTEENGEGTARARLQLAGRGGPLAEFAVERVARLQRPFEFTWRQRSWKPWDWVLLRVEQPELELAEY